MPFEELLDAKEIRETRKSKWLKISTVDELIGVLDIWFMKRVISKVNLLTKTKKSNVEIELHSPFKKSIKSKSRKEGPCDYVENNDPTLDMIVKNLKKKWFKIVFFQKKYLVDDRDGKHRNIGTFMSVSL